MLVDEGQGDYVWGHISARLPDNPGRFLMKPGCLGIEEMSDDNIITVDIEGEKVSGWMREIMNGVAEGWIRPHVDRAFPFDQVADAHRYIEARKNIGKVVLVP